MPGARRVKDIRHPTPEEMTAALLEAAEAGRWSHWEHEVTVHARDWVKTAEMPKPLKPEQFRKLPEVVGKYGFVELCVYGYRGRTVWAFYSKRLPFQGHKLSQVLVVLDPMANEIVHCMHSKRGKRYCERWGEQEKLFVKVRW